MRWRAVLIDGPARITDTAGRWYAILLFAASLVAITNAALILLLYFLGIRLFW